MFHSDENIGCGHCIPSLSIDTLQRLRHRVQSADYIDEAPIANGQRAYVIYVSPVDRAYNPGLYHQLNSNKVGRVLFVDHLRPWLVLQIDGFCWVS
jgi:hypothetical protein